LTTFSSLIYLEYHVLAAFNFKMNTLILVFRKQESRRIRAQRPPNCKLVDLIEVIHSLPIRWTIHSHTITVLNWLLWTSFRIWEAFFICHRQKVAAKTQRGCL